jgi:MYXO-CTERM domain-containing protein
MRSIAANVLSLGRNLRARVTQSHIAWQLCAGTLVAATPAAALAFSTGSSATDGCHEAITSGAWKTARATFPEQGRALPASGDDQALIDDVPFRVPKSLRDIGGTTLLLGVRDNDIKEHGPTDLKELAPAASDPKTQHEHCLRAPDQDEPGGSEEAVEACRQYIREQLSAALDGLDDTGKPDASKREELTVSLAIRGEDDVDEPQFFLEAGRGLHALQDSFTHTFRNPDDPGKIRVVLNWVDYTEGTLDEAKDGPPHASELDVCDDPDALRTERHQLASESSAVVLTALIDPSLTRTQKESAIEDVLDRYVAYDKSADCSVENDWCDAPERKYGSPTLGCSFSGSVPRSNAALLGALGVALLLGWRRRRHVVPAAFALAVVCSSGAAHADEQGPIDSPAAALSGQSDAAVPGRVDKPGAFFARIAVGASYDNAAFSTGAGLHYQLTRKWVVGLDGEWNPYVATNPGKVRMGSANAYFSLIRRYQLKFETINVRTTVSAGGSMLLFDLVGADKYSFGPYVGISFLGAEWKVARGFYLTLDPTYIALPIPSVTGVPFMYAQYRFLLGVEFGG